MLSFLTRTLREDMVTGVGKGASEGQRPRRVERERKGGKKVVFFRGRNPLKKIDQVIKRKVKMSIMIKLR